MSFWMYGCAIRTAAAVTTRNAGIRKASNAFAPNAQRTIQKTSPMRSDTRTCIRRRILASEAVAHRRAQLRRPVEGGDHRPLGLRVLRRHQTHCTRHLEAVLVDRVA